MTRTVPTPASAEPGRRHSLAPLTAAAQPPYAALPAPSADARVAAVYLHVPFCTTKCHYCDFYSLAGHLDAVPAYLDALETEFTLQAAHFGPVRPDTVFIGGGTPTLLDPAHLDRLLALLHTHVDLSAVGEFTIEANPNTFCAERAAVLRARGVNRISFGAQSFHRGELAMLQRDHEPANVARAMALARAAGITNLNLDLIFGIPGQTLASWADSLRQALALAPDHLSCYSLIYEPNTPLAARRNAGQVTPLDEDLELALFDHTYARLRGAGFERYEVSNYARPGRACRHNLHYWLGHDYLAFGPAAAGGYHHHRWKNVQSLQHYVAALSATDPVLPVVQMEHLSPVRRAGELMMLQLRLAEGLLYERLIQATGLDPRPRLARVLGKYRGLGLLVEHADRLCLTEPGVAVSDTILADVLRDFED